MAHIFISYAKIDTRPLAEALHTALHTLPGVTAWMDSSLEADDSWTRQIEENIDRADYVIVLLSPDVNRAVTPTRRRSFVLNEIDYAQEANKPILPVMVTRTKMPVAIAGTQYIDLTATPNDPAKILDRVRQRFGIAQPVSLSNPLNAPPPRPTPRPTPTRTIIAIGAGVLAVIAVLVIVLNGGLGGGMPTTTPPAIAVGPSATPPALVQVTITSAAREPSAAERLATLNASDTQVAATRTVQQATETAAAIGAATVSEEARRFFATETSAMSTLLARSFTPTHTPTLTPLQAALQAAQTFTGSNTDWTPYSEPDARGVPMVLVPAGCFMMGSEDGDSDERPVEEQCFDAPFWIDLTEVTRAQYDACVADGGEGCTAETTNQYADQPEQPINYVDWFQASAYCAWRGARLPTEAEWEYAARGPAAWVYPWGDDFDAARVIYVGNSGSETAAVGAGIRTAGASWVGALDMAGNVWEWTSTLYRDYPYEAQDGREGQGNRTDGRVLRGGSWLNAESNSRAANRDSNSTSVDGNYVGLRCALSFSDSDF